MNISNHIKKIFKVLVISFFTIFVFSGFLTRDNDIYFEISKGIDLFGKVYREVTLNYVDDINPKEFVIAGIEGMLNSLDPYTAFIDVYEQKDIDLITKGKYGGIGASIGLRNDEVTVIDLVENAPAQRQGMKVGDVIKKIDDVEMNKDNYEKLGYYLKGDIGSVVNILVLRNEEEINFNLVREEIEIKNVSYFGFVPKESSNAYIKLSSFSQTAGYEIKEAILKLKSEKEIESLVLDLRGNPGGLLDAAVDVCEKFLPKGSLIVTVKGRDTANFKNYFVKEEPILSNQKIVVLVNESTASAAEVVAGALQDHDRAVIVGENSFGKGLVQTLISLPYNSSLKLTTAKYFTPSGRCIQKIDYTNKNNVLKNNSLNKNEFLTDNKRKVFALGGILPDSIIKTVVEDEIESVLKAEGLIFRFVTNYLNDKKEFQLNKTNNDELFYEFKKFLNEQKFTYNSKSLRLIKQLEEIKNRDKNKKLDEILSELKNIIEQMDGNKLNANKDKIISEIKIEIAARILGKDGRFSESLKNDLQFQKSLELIKNDKKFYALLNFRN